MSKQTSTYIFANVLKRRILFKDILTFLGLYYRDASHITLYLVVIGISIPKMHTNNLVTSIELLSF